MPGFQRGAELLHRVEHAAIVIGNSHGVKRVTIPLTMRPCSGVALSAVFAARPLKADELQILRHIHPKYARLSDWLDRN